MDVFDLQPYKMVSPKDRLWTESKYTVYFTNE